MPAARVARVGAGIARLRDTSRIILQRVRHAGAVAPASPAALAEPGMPVEGQVRPAALPALYVYIRAAHVFLALGLIALGLALALPWATSKHGLPLYLRDFTSPRLAHAGVPVTGWAISAASNMVFLGACLGILLIVANVGAIAVNVSAYQGNLPGCLAGLLTPAIIVAGFALLLDLALMAGFGLLGLLTQFPGLYAAGLTNQAASGPGAGFFLWWVGILLSFMGTVGQMNMRTRVL